MDITDPGFQDFRSDASCQIRPQSLIGEKFVDCRPTLPRAPGSPAPPPLKQIPDGQPGAGEYLLPLGNNSTSVDPDLINDIQTLPYAQRFRLIFNELGAGLAGRGDDIEVAGQARQPGPARRRPPVRHPLRPARPAGPAGQRLGAILGPLSRERAHVAGFFTNSGAAAQASSEHGAELEESLQKFPDLPARVPPDDAQPAGLLRRRHARSSPTSARRRPSLTDATRTADPVLGSARPWR